MEYSCNEHWPFQHLSRAPSLRSSSLASGNVPNLTSRRSPTPDRSRFASVLVSSPAVRMGSRDHRLSLDNRPFSSSSPLQEPARSRLHEWFLSTSRTSNDTNHRSTIIIHVNRLSRVHTQFRANRRMRDNCCKGTG